MCQRLLICLESFTFLLTEQKDAKLYKCSKITSRYTKQGEGGHGGCFRVKGEKTPSLGSAGEQGKGDKYSKQGDRHLFARRVEINGAEIWILMSPQREKFLKENKQYFTERERERERKGVKNVEEHKSAQIIFYP